MADRRIGSATVAASNSSNLFVYGLCDLDPAWIAAVRRYGWVLVQLGLRVLADRADAEHVRATELDTAHKDGLVTGGLMQRGQVRTP